MVTGCIWFLSTRTDCWPMRTKGVIMERKMELQVRKDVCIGCGLCAESCPQHAISVQWGQAQIDQQKCDHCGLCLDVCPQGAIVELVPISKEELAATLTGLKDKADNLIARIEKLTKQCITDNVQRGKTA